MVLGGSGLQLTVGCDAESEFLIFIFLAAAGLGGDREQDGHGAARRQCSKKIPTTKRSNCDSAAVGEAHSGGQKSRERLRYRSAWRVENELHERWREFLKTRDQTSFLLSVVGSKSHGDIDILCSLCTERRKTAAGGADGDVDRQVSMRRRSRVGGWSSLPSETGLEIPKPGGHKSGPILSRHPLWHRSRVESLLVEGSSWAL